MVIVEAMIEERMDEGTNEGGVVFRLEKIRGRGGKELNV